MHFHAATRLQQAGEHAWREVLLHRNVQQFRGGLVSQAHGLCVPLNSRLESNESDEEGAPTRLCTPAEHPLHPGQREEPFPEP